MSYQWRPVSGSFYISYLEQHELMPTFTTQQEAEDWMSLFWSDLLNAGVGEVSLWENDREVHPPMPLTP